jgi:hypothetical protein
MNYLEKSRTKRFKINEIQNKYKMEEKKKKQQKKDGSQRIRTWELWR